MVHGKPFDQRSWYPNFKGNLQLISLSLLAEIDQVKDAFREITQEKLISQEAYLFNPARLIWQFIHLVVIFLLRSISGLHSMFDNDVGEVWTSTHQHVLSKVEHFHTGRWEPELINLTFFLAVGESTDAVKVPQYDVAITEQSANLAHVRRKLSFVEIAALLGKK